MQAFADKKGGIYWQISLVALALIFLLLNLNKYPLVDYDEATYAKVTMDTMESGQLLSLKLSGESWFDKPPLFFWLAMGSVKIFGENEFAFRFPSVILGILCLWITWLILKKITGKNVIASAAFLILLFSPPFNYYIREMRLDSGVVLSILVALLALIMGWKEKKWLILIIPAISAGFLFKSFISFLAFPVLLIICIFFRRWDWLKSKFFWLGAVLGLIIAVPWHLAMHLLYGKPFWEFYLVRQIFQRAGTGFNVEKPDYLSYFKMLWNFNQPWTLLVILLFLIFLFFVYKRKEGFKVQNKPLLYSSLSVAILILMLFTIFKTHIFTYILPVYPFLAIIAVLIFYDFYYNYYRIRKIIMVFFSLMLVWGAFGSLGLTGSFIDEVVKPFHAEQKEAALVYKDKNILKAPLYLLDWFYPEAIRYYGKTDIKKIALLDRAEGTIKGPAYFLTDVLTLRLFFGSNNNALPEYRLIEVPYSGKYLILLFSRDDLVLPRVEQLDLN